MVRSISKVHEGWWDYTTLNPEILSDAAKLTAKDIEQLERPGFTVRMYDSFDLFWVAEAMEYIHAWKRATPDNPVGICGPIGPTEQLPLVAQIVNDLQINLRSAHFWGMDEWYVDGKEVAPTHPLSFAKADMDLCFNRIDKKYRMPDDHLHFPTMAGIEAFSRSFDEITCAVMQGGQGEVKHWAFNDPPARTGDYVDAPPPPEEYRKLGTRVVTLHPLTLIQNARTSASGRLDTVSNQALTVGPRETWKAEKVSIWHPGWHDNPFGMRLSAFMISKGLADSSVPMSLLADHPNVQFNYYRPGIGSTDVEMH